MNVRVEIERSYDDRYLRVSLREVTTIQVYGYNFYEITTIEV